MLVLLATSTSSAAAASDAAIAPPAARFSDWTGARVMEENFARHQQFPYVYEEYTLVLIDEAGHREVRRARRYTRVAADRTAKFLLVFDRPEEIRGVAVLATRSSGGDLDASVYLPAYGPTLKRPRAAGTGDEPLLGTDLTVLDLTAESPADFRYRRVDDRVTDEVVYFVVDAWPRVARGRAARCRHLVRQDNLVIAESECFDAGERLVRRLTRHDLQPVSGASWRANMLIVDDLRAHHRTLLKVDRREYSRDYVPAALFEPAALFAGRHLAQAGPPG